MREAYLLDQSAVDNEDVSVESSVLLPVGVSNIIDSEESGEQAVRGRPLSCVLVNVVWDEFLVDLRPEVEHCGQVLGDKICRDSCTSVCQIVGLYEALIVGDCQKIHPVRPVRRGVAWVRRVSQRISRVGLCSRWVEASGGVRITTRNCGQERSLQTLKVWTYNTKNFSTFSHPLQYFADDVDVEDGALDVVLVLDILLDILLGGRVEVAMQLQALESLLASHFAGT